MPAAMHICVVSFGDQMQTTFYLYTLGAWKMHFSCWLQITCFPGFWIPTFFLYRKTQIQISRQNSEIDHFFPPKLNLTIWSASAPKMAHGPPPLGGLGPKFQTLIFSLIF